MQLPSPLARRLLALALAPLALACGSGDARDTTGSPRAAVASGTKLLDDFGDTLVVARRFQRIVSLAPSTTEALFAMGLGPRLVGRSHWDQWPAAAHALPDLGPGIRPSVERVLAARPDLVVLYASGDNRAVATQLRAAGVATLALRGDRLADFRRTVELLGRATGDTAAARAVADSVEHTLAAVRARYASSPRPSVLLPTWDDPLIVIGGGSFLSELVEIAGGRNVYGDLAQPSPQVSMEDVVRRDPDVVLVGPESRGRLLVSPAWRALRAVREGRVVAYDTMIVGRPSVTLGAAAEHLARLIHATAAR